MVDVKDVIEVLSPEKLEKLWHGYKVLGDDKAKDQILLHYTHLVKWIVRRMMPKYNNYNEYDDLVSCGMIGLIDAVDKFDLKFDVKFETYAVARIRGEILDYMRAQDWAPPSLRKKINAINNVIEEMENRNEEPPSDQRVADTLNIPIEQVQKILNQTHMFNIVNFEEALSTSLTSESDISDENSPEKTLIDKEKKKILVEAIDSLPEKERLVITLYYYEGLLLKDIADILQVTQSRVSQIHSKVLVKMRAKLQKSM